MAEDNRASYARVGFTVALGVAAIAATLVWFGGFRGRDSEFLVETYYDHSVSGLSVGSAVNFCGVKIGEVREIGFAPIVYGREAEGVEDAQRVIIVMAIDRGKSGYENATPAEIEAACAEQVRQGLRATVTSSGITGLSRVEFSLCNPAPPPAKLAWRPHHILIPSSPSLLDNFTVAATKTMNRLKTMDFERVWSNLAAVASSASALSANANTLVESQSAAIATIVQNVESASASLRQLADTLKDNPSLILRARDAEPLDETR